ncbi:hypothetical protein HRE53_07225 [Acaryochloris sp. 'Moss Beach']|uniref:hypothetical protein n=1 Tax=Acaryochloris sp. 'Moss Beach' TaxID=2740837 RepID=UPI001F4922C0|nr:hypothetical protein [Acaryochloris sp. 'Moss Beach']UJB70834.1 hypothetical protein HRE53_07225 [Acaryochloris sp. 'Moss Beach']
MRSLNRIAPNRQTVAQSLLLSTEPNLISGTVAFLVSWLRVFIAKTTWQRLTTII